MRTGKIARLPYETREELNNRLRNGESSATILPFLHQHNPTINDQNLTNWRQGGYKEWLQQQTRLDRIRTQAEDMRRELEAGGFSMLDKAICSLAERLCDDEQNPLKAASAVAALKNAVLAQQRAELEQKKVQLAEQNAQLEREKFNLKFAEAFLLFHNDAKARAIADSDSSSDAKIKALLEYMQRQEQG